MPQAQGLHRHYDIGPLGGFCGPLLLGQRGQGQRVRRDVYTTREPGSLSATGASGFPGGCEARGWRRASNARVLSAKALGGVGPVGTCWPLGCASCQGRGSRRRGLASMPPWCEQLVRGACVPPCWLGAGPRLGPSMAGLAGCRPRCLQSPLPAASPPRHLPAPPHSNTHAHKRLTLCARRLPALVGHARQSNGATLQPAQVYCPDSQVEHCDFTRFVRPFGTFEAFAHDAYAG